jgi:hypothetical protein
MNMRDRKNEVRAAMRWKNRRVTAVNRGVGHVVEDLDGHELRM